MTEIVSLFGVYLMIFLFGMTVMRLGLNTASQHTFKKMLLKYTNTPWKGFLLGILITAIVQSSSAVMVILVGLVAANLMSFRQSIGIILGTNIGTTITTEIISFDLDQLILPFVLVGALCIFIKGRAFFCTGCAVFGLGCMFLAMNGFESLANPITSLSWIQHFLQMTNNHIFYGLGLGTAMTAIIQSSTATTAIIMALMNENILSLSSGITILLGANIGTCVTALLASIGTIREAKFVAMAHIWVNLFGVAFFLPFLNLFSELINVLTYLPDVQIAHASVIFNVISSLLLLPCAGILASFITKIHGRKVA
ncbi:Na/Pi symporter [Alkalihalobacillus sp. AL-G]|uniref:Na/Pi symporter n=1 Tax=Alkalihalobacillus sp. AL-G TaxID=2926399 RepID=UPI0027297FD5|nr:Na/Pi symporter [Alkalihalobacillus sp. AL-G]WLD92130.1 Na/Pi symporter [Alkalihalobacillus sp. AL-G]